MKTKKQSGIVLVYDRYYGKKPSALVQTLKKALYCTALCVCAALFLIIEYKMPVNLWAAAGICALFGVFFSAVFSLVKKKVAIPIFVFFAGIIIFFNRASLWERVSYFTDLIIMRMNGVMFYTEKFTFHTDAQLQGTYPPCADGVLLGVCAFVCIFAMITAAAMFRKPVIYPSFILFILLSAPVAVAGNFEFNFWVIPALALYIGAISLSKTYSEGVAIKKGFFGSFRSDTRKEERDFRNKAAKATFVKRARMNGIFYSKYLASACWATAIFTACALIANSFAPVKEGFDYSEFYNFLNNLGQSSGITSPFENGPVSEYFSSYGTGANSSLNIISPGKSNQEILRVSSPAGEVYLRGDIGIEFTGTTWTSPIRHESDLWKNSRLSDVYRPAEMRILQTMAQTQSAWKDDVEISDVSSFKGIIENEITVDYLCPTDVVFLPAYTSEFGFFENEMFDVYGDYSVRVNQNYERINTVKCIALDPQINYTGSERSNKRLNFEYLEKIGENYLMDEVFDTYLNASGLYEDYKNYVYDTYLAVPEGIKTDIDSYLLNNNLFYNVYADGKVDAQAGYEAAVDITDFLMNNYTYSLDAKINMKNPIMSFLNDVKSGHCALFASSMTLMLRELGIPARYCTGFVAPKTEGENYAILRSKNLHAWCEAYFDEIGWVTVDPTSSARANTIIIENSSEEQSSESSESSEASSEKSESVVSDSSDIDTSDINSEHSKNSDNTTENPSGSPVVPEENPPVDASPIILTVVGILLVIGAIVLTSVKLKSFDKNARKALKRLYKIQTAEPVYMKMLAVFALCGLTAAAGELPEQFYERCENKLFVPITAHKNVLLKAAFASVTDETEIAELARLLESIFNAADKKLNRMDRFKLRLIILAKK